MKIVQREFFGVSLKDNIEQGIYLEEDKLIINSADRSEVVLPVESIPLKGKHNIYNIAFASLIAYLAGASTEAIKEGVYQFIPEPHRLEEVTVLKDRVMVIDDSKATNPHAAINALKSFDQPIVLIAGGQDRDADFF